MDIGQVNNRIREGKAELVRIKRESNANDDLCVGEREQEEEAYCMSGMDRARWRRKNKRLQMKKRSEMV